MPCIVYDFNANGVEPDNVIFDGEFPGIHQFAYEYGPEEERYFYHSDHLGSSTFITDAAGNPYQFLQYLPFGEPFVSQHVNMDGWATLYTFSAKEQDAETGYHYFGARYYDSELSVWLSVDPMADEAPGWTPYRYGFNNPMNFIDPFGLLETDYYDAETGEHLEHVDDGIDEAIAIRRNVYDALKEDGNLTNADSKAVGGQSLGKNSDFEMIAATLYAEAGYVNPNSEESAAIYDVLENRSDESDKEVTDLIKESGVYGYGSKDYKIAKAKGKGYKKGQYSESRHNAARKGAMMGILTNNSSFDYSQGAYFWDASRYLNNPLTYKSNFFNQYGHGNTVGTLSKNITFSYTTKIGATQFMKYNPKIHPNKTWP